MKDLKSIAMPNADQVLGTVFSAHSPVVAPSRAPAESKLTGIWVQTSIKMQDTTRKAVKLYALEHCVKMQEIIDLALRDYLEKASEHQN